MPIVEQLADRPDLIEAATDLRWREWGHEPEPTDRGRDQLPLTWVVSDTAGVLGAVGLGQFDIEECHDRSPWVLGLMVRSERRGAGLGRRLPARLEQWASRTVMPRYGSLTKAWR